MKEAKLIGFKVLLDRKGRLTTEVSGLPLDKVDEVFENFPDKHLYKVLIRESTYKIEELIKHLEKELGSI